MARRGVKILDADPGVRRRTGIRPGDLLCKVNGSVVEDELDVLYQHGGEAAELEVSSGSGRGSRSVFLGPEDVYALCLEPMTPRRCANRCVFCFVDQLPPGLRPTLYVKDEDYRFSFLYGNYVTLTAVRERELDRICRQRLSPIYVSVHATEAEVRNRLLGIRRGRRILPALRRLAGAGIELHAQIVLCPGINDGRVLERTVRDLAGLRPAVCSVAVVPVGLTRHRARNGLPDLRRVTSTVARKTIININSLKSELEQEGEVPFLFLSDEFYLRAEVPLPPLEAYADLPQWENGVGMLPVLLREIERSRRRRPGRVRLPRELRVSVATGEMAAPFVRRYLEQVGGRWGVRIEAVAVPNRLFGRSVRVAGLMAGRDVIAVFRKGKGANPLDLLMIPDVALDAGGRRFLDDLAPEDVGRALGVPVATFLPDPKGFEDVLRRVARRMQGGVGSANGSTPA